MSWRLIPVAILCTLCAIAQVTPAAPGPLPGRETVREVAEARIASARRLVERGRTADALRAWRDALVMVPGDREVLAGIVAAAETIDPVGLGLARFDLALAALDARGRMDRDRDLAKALGKDARALRTVVETRAALVLACVQLAKKQLTAREGMAGRVVARELLERARRLAIGAPALEERLRADLAGLDEAQLPNLVPILKAMKAAMDRALAERRFDRAILIARTLGALATQAGFHDLEGPEAPDLRAAGMAARAGLARARAGREESAPPKIWTVDELMELDFEARKAFDERHASWSNPAVAVTPEGLYRVETTCGHATLLGAARTLELHHRRLVSWYGRDPFEGRPGLVRIVPRSAGLESEGTPYWWAQGFQRGDLTTVKFSSGTIEGLGRTLTHELTHRFDGAIYGGFPGWLSEGRAVWTGGAYGGSADETFVDRHLNVGTVERTYIQGYAGKRRLEELINGTIADYRDNYFAGYALFQYLSTWREGGRELFTGPLARYLATVGRARGDRVAHFVKHFADGKAGRPADLDAFQKGWATYLRGHHWQSRAGWLSEYVTRLPRVRDDYVYDGATWHRDRVRSEPWLGQDQALIAARLLGAEGDQKAAALAYAWAIELEEPEPVLALEAAAVLAEQKKDLAAWAILCRAHDRFGRPAAPEPPKALTRGKRSMQALVVKLQEAIDGLRATRPRLCGALDADLVRIITGLGLVPAARPRLVAAEEPGEAPRALDPAPRHLGPHGWLEEGLSGYEERRVEGLWFDDAEGDLTVGRERPREGTGTRDRRARQRHAYARSRWWVSPGRYTLHGRIHATTSYISGAVVVGVTRRDRNARVRFTAGDFLFAIGAKEEAARFDSVRVSVDGLHEREGGLSGAEPSRNVKLRNVGSSFEVRILIDGPEMTVRVDDTVVGSYHTPDGRPIEGFVGFAAGQGAFRASRWVVERHDRRAHHALDADWPRGLDIGVAGKAPGREIRNRRTTGLPLGPRGTVVLFVPPLREKGGDGPVMAGSDLALSAVLLAEKAHEAIIAAGLEARLVVAVPERIGTKDREKLVRDLQEVAPLFEAPVFHRWEGALDFVNRPKKSPSPQASLLFLDPLGVLRVHGRAGLGRIPRGIVHQARVFAARDEAPDAGFGTGPEDPPEEGGGR